MLERWGEFCSSLYEILNATQYTQDVSINTLISPEIHLSIRQHKTSCKCLSIDKYRSIMLQLKIYATMNKRYV